MKDPLFSQREEKWVNEESLAQLLHDDDTVGVSGVPITLTITSPATVSPTLVTTGASVVLLALQ